MPDRLYTQCPNSFGRALHEACLNASLMKYTSTVRSDGVSYSCARSRAVSNEVAVKKVTTGNKICKGKIAGYKN